MWQTRSMGVQGVKLKRKSTLGYMHWLSRTEIWFLSMLDPLKEVINQLSYLVLFLFSFYEYNNELGCIGLSFTEADKRLKESGPNVPLDYSFPSWWNLLWSAFFHPFNIILIVLSAISYFTSDSPNGCIMLALVFISVSLRFYQVFFFLIFILIMLWFISYVYIYNNNNN